MTFIIIIIIIFGFVTRLVPLVEQELRTLPDQLRSPMFSEVRVAQSLFFFSVHCLFFCPSFCPMYCLSSFDLWLLIIPLVASNLSFVLLFFLFWPFYCLFFYWRLLITPLEFEFEFELWCLTPLSAIFQLYHGDQF